MIVADTGPLVAASDRKDPRHAICREAVLDVLDELVVPAPVIVEVCWLLGRGGADVEAGFLEEVYDRTFTVEPLGLDDYRRAAELVRQYGDLPLGMVDASVVAVAERLGASTVLTLNRRDFAVVRPRHVTALAMIPTI